MAAFIVVWNVEQWASLCIATTKCSATIYSLRDSGLEIAHYQKKLAVYTLTTLSCATYAQCQKIRL